MGLVSLGGLSLFCFELLVIVDLNEPRVEVFAVFGNRNGDSCGRSNGISGELV